MPTICGVLEKNERKTRLVGLFERVFRTITAKLGSFKFQIQKLKISLFDINMKYINRRRGYA